MESYLDLIIFIDKLCRFLRINYLLYRCKIGRSVGTSASVVGGSLTIAGGILTLTTAGAAAPLLIAGIATSSVGAATNIGTSIIEKAINSKQVNNLLDTPL